MVMWTTCLLFACVSIKGFPLGSVLQERCTESVEALDCRNVDLTGVKLRRVELPSVVRMDGAQGLNPDTWPCRAFGTVDSLSVIGTGLPCSVFEKVLSRCGVQLRLRCDPDPVKATAEPVIKNTKTTAKTMKFVTSTPSETSTGILTSSTKASTGVVTASSSSGLPSGPIWGGIGFLFATLVGVNIGVHYYRKQKVARMLAERRRAAAVRWAREMEVQNANLRPRRPHVAFVPTRPLRAVPICGSVTVDVELENFSTPPESPK